MARYRLHHAVLVCLALVIPALTCGVGPAVEDLTARVAALEAEAETQFTVIDANGVEVGTLSHVAVQRAYFEPEHLIALAGLVLVGITILVNHLRENARRKRDEHVRFHQDRISASSEYIAHIREIAFWLPHGGTVPVEKIAEIRRCFTVVDLVGTPETRRIASTMMQLIEILLEHNTTTQGLTLDLHQRQQFREDIDRQIDAMTNEIRSHLGEDSPG